MIEFSMENLSLLKKKLYQIWLFNRAVSCCRSKNKFSLDSARIYNAKNKWLITVEPLVYRIKYPVRCENCLKYPYTCLIHDNAWKNDAIVFIHK